MNTFQNNLKRNFLLKLKIIYKMYVKTYVEAVLFLKIVYTTGNRCNCIYCTFIIQKYKIKYQTFLLLTLDFGQT